MSQLFLEGFFEIKPIYALPSFSGEQIATKLRGSFKEVVHAINSGWDWKLLSGKALSLFKSFKMNLGIFVTILVVFSLWNTAGEPDRL